MEHILGGIVWKIKVIAFQFGAMAWFRYFSNMSVTGFIFVPIFLMGMCVEELC